MCRDLSQQYASRSWTMSMITMEMVGAALYDNNLHLRINEAKFVANFTQKMCKNNYILSNLLSYDIAPHEIHLEKWQCRTALYSL